MRPDPDPGLAPRSVYLDYQATAPVDPRVFETMLPWLREEYGNPHSAHAWGNRAAAAIETARGEIAAVIGAEPREIVFTSGATEANNLAIKGAARFIARHGGKRRRIVTVATEHKCVLESCADLAAEGFEIATLPVGTDGLIAMDRLDSALDDSTALVSVMAANNEIGVIQDLAAIGKIARERGVLFHCDAAQGFGKIRLDVDAMAIGLLSLSGHKIYGPKGVGALYVRHRPRVRLLPLLSGGGQERGFRSGTLPTPLIAGLGAAAEIARREMVPEAERLKGLRDRFLEDLAHKIEGVAVNGALSPRLPGNLNLSFAGVSALDLIDAVPDLALATGSACSAASVEPSYVLSALGLPRERVIGGIRLGIGRQTSREDLAYAAARLSGAVHMLRGR